MSITGLALSVLLSRCAPMVAPNTMAAIISVESTYDPYAIGDNDARRSYHPANYAEAVNLATQLLSEGHNLDLGLSQVNSSNMAVYRISLLQAFDPCWNVNVGGRILQGDYNRAAAVYGPGRIALFHALGAYNTGSIYKGSGYADKVVSAAYTPGVALASTPMRAYPQPVAVQVHYMTPSGRWREERATIHYPAAVVKALVIHGPTKETKKLVTPYTSPISAYSAKRNAKKKP